MALGAFLRRQRMEFDVDGGLSRGFLLRSTSYPPYKANEAFSRFLYSRESLAEIPPSLPLTLDDESSSLKKQIESLKKKNEGLQKKIEDLQEKYDALKCEAVLRQILSNFLESKDYKNVNKYLMDKALEMYPEALGMYLKELPRGTTFTALIRKLLEANRLPNEATKHKLNCLREAAKSFRSRSLPWWDEKKGDQFYILCFKVAQWNNSTFHPEIKGLTKCTCMNKAHKGLYKYDGVDAGPLVKELLHA